MLFQWKLTRAGYREIVFLVEDNLRRDAGCEVNKNE